MVATVTLEIGKWTETDADVDPRPYAAQSVVLSRSNDEQHPRGELLGGRDSIEPNRTVENRISSRRGLIYTLFFFLPR